MTQRGQDNRIDYVELNVQNIDDAKSFYGAVFGWTFTDYGPAYSSFFDGRLSGGFEVGDSRGPGGPLVVIYSTNLEALVASVLRHGGRIAEEIFEFPGGRRFHFSDPSGNILAVWSDQ